MNTNEEGKPVKLCIRKSGVKAHETSLWLNDPAIGQLRILNTFYEKVLGRGVANSIIMRRAIGLLFDRVSKMIKEKAIADMKQEGIDLTGYVRN